MLFLAEKTRMDGTGKTKFDIKTAVAARHDSSGYKESGNNISDLVCNIYDLEGNYREWTSEANGGIYRVFRGGYYNGSTSASYRNNEGNYGYPNDPAGTRGYYSSRRCTLCGIVKTAKLEN